MTSKFLRLTSLTGEPLDVQLFLNSLFARPAAIFPAPRKKAIEDVCKRLQSYAANKLPEGVTVHVSTDIPTDIASHLTNLTITVAKPQNFYGIPTGSQKHIRTVKGRPDFAKAGALVSQNDIKTYVCQTYTEICTAAKRVAQDDDIDTSLFDSTDLSKTLNGLREAFLNIFERHAQSFIDEIADAPSQRLSSVDNRKTILVSLSDFDASPS